MIHNTQLDAIRAKDDLRERVIDVIASQSFVRDEGVAKACRALWDAEHGIVGPLWVEAVFGCEASGDTLESLLQQQVLDQRCYRQIASSSVFPSDRQLYIHQSRSLRLAATADASRRPGIVITAGTGAGKTEAFLLPLLNDLYSHPRGPSESGVRAILLYPMNALVNDQVARIRKWLAGQNDVRFCYYTGETPEDDYAASKLGINPKRGGPEITTREAARKAPPDILVTNYSMLEYLLCRPQDASLFGPALRSVVLDEAHLYSGTLAAEIALLLRRVQLRSGVDPSKLLHIAASATLAGDVVEFASKLFWKPAEDVTHIHGTSQRQALGKPCSPLNRATVAEINLVGLDSITLVHESELAGVGAEEARTAVAPLVGTEALNECHDELAGARVLWKALRRSPMVIQLEEFLWARRADVILPLSDISIALWDRPTPDALEATAKLLQLCARARENATELPLIPHKLHLQVRTAVTVSACLNPKCTAPPELRVPGAGGLVADVVDRCRWCSAATLTIARCENCGEWCYTGTFNEQDSALSPRYRWSGENPNLRFAKGTAQNPDFWFDYESRQCLTEGDRSVPMQWLEVCPNCSERALDFKPVGVGDQLALPVVAETLLADMPPMATPSQAWLPARGRRLLVFSDSRREAARLGPHLTVQHEVHLGRKLILRCLLANAPDPTHIALLEQQRDLLRRQLALPNLNAISRTALSNDSNRLEQALRTAAEGQPISDWAAVVKSDELLGEFFDREGAARARVAQWNQAAWEANQDQARKRTGRLLIREFASPNWRQTSLETLGLAEIVYPGLSSIEPPDEIMGLFPSAAAMSRFQAAWSHCIAALCDTLRLDRVISLGTLGDDLTDFYYPVGRWICEDDRLGAYLTSFVGAADTLESRRNLFCRKVLLAAGLSEPQATEFAPMVLRAVFRGLYSAAEKGLIGCLEPGKRQGSDGTPRNAIRLKLPDLVLRVPGDVPMQRYWTHMATIGVGLRARKRKLGDARADKRAHSRERRASPEAPSDVPGRRRVRCRPLG
jgi:DEAD/DEAH box helicase domain-containing protein